MENLYIRLQWINDFYIIVLIDLDNLLSNFLPVELGAEFLIKNIQGGFVMALTLVFSEVMMVQNWVMVI